MTLSRIICVALACQLVDARYIGTPKYDIPISWGSWYNQRQPDQRAHFLPHPSGYVPFPHVNPGYLNHQGQHSGNRHVTHVQQTLVVANNLHIQKPSALNNTRGGNEHVHLQNKVESAPSRSWSQTNTQQELNVSLQNRNANQSSHIENRPSTGLDQILRLDNGARQNPGLSQRSNNQIHISFRGASNSLPSNISDRHQASTDGKSSPGRIFVQSRGTINISHPRGSIEISRSNTGHSNIIIKTNTNNTNGTPQREIPAELSKITHTTDTPDVEAMVTSKYGSTAEEVEHEAP